MLYPLYSFSAQVRHALLVLRTAFVSQRTAEEQSTLARLNASIQTWLRLIM